MRSCTSCSSRQREGGALRAQMAPRTPELAADRRDPLVPIQPPLRAPGAAVQMAACGGKWLTSFACGSVFDLATGSAMGLAKPLGGAPRGGWAFGRRRGSRSLQAWPHGGGRTGPDAVTSPLRPADQAYQVPFDVAELLEAFLGGRVRQRTHPHRARHELPALPDRGQGIPEIASLFAQRVGVERLARLAINDAAARRIWSYIPGHLTSRCSHRPHQSR